VGKLQGYIQTGDASDLEIVVSWKNAFRLHERSETLPDGKLTQRSGFRKSRFREKIYEAQRNALRDLGTESKFLQRGRSLISGDKALSERYLLHLLRRHLLSEGRKVHWTGLVEQITTGGERYLATVMHLNLMHLNFRISPSHFSTRR
jgi:hypothetical protein